jgi:hypothetical protein
MMHAFFIWLETSFLSVWVRESDSLFAFPAILTLHTIGMGFVAGLSAAIDLRILGVAAVVPLMELRRFFPLIWVAFWLNAASGAVLLIAYPTKALTNPVFYLKLAFIALAMVAYRSLLTTVFADPTFDMKRVSRKGRLLAGGSLACWTSAIVAGRLLAYTYSKLSSL